MFREALMNIRKYYSLIIMFLNNNKYEDNHSYSVFSDYF